MRYKGDCRIPVKRIGLALSAGGQGKLLTQKNSSSLFMRRLHGREAVDFAGVSSRSRSSSCCDGGIASGRSRSRGDSSNYQPSGNLRARSKSMSPTTARACIAAVGIPKGIGPRSRCNSSRRGFFNFSTSNGVQSVDAIRSPVECGVVSPLRKVPDHIPKTPYYASGSVPLQDSFIHLHTPETLERMRLSCTLARDILDLCCSMAQPGVMTDEIDAAAHAAIVEAGACPSPLNYHGFPKSICSSVNEVACHAIPDDRPLQDGDIVSFDVSVYRHNARQALEWHRWHLNVSKIAQWISALYPLRGHAARQGLHGDNCSTVGVGTVDDAALRLMDATQEAMLAGVQVCRPGACLTDIGSAIHDVADRYGFDTVRKYCGHGLGSGFHMLPFVEHFRNNRRLEMVPGMTFTIEPIFTEGSEATTIHSDGWTVRTRDGGRAAQFEHVVLITEEGHEILTVPSKKR